MATARLKDKIINLLTWWADRALNGIEVNGYSSHSAICDMIVMGRSGGSRPLLTGPLRDDFKRVDDILRIALTDRQYLISVGLFSPGALDAQQRAAALQISRRYLFDVRNLAIEAIEGNLNMAFGWRESA